MSETRKIVITGASGGLGTYLIERLGSDFEIIGTYKGHEPRHGLKATFYKVDVTDAESVNAFVARIRPSLERVMLINLAGISIDSIAHKMPDAVWDQVVDTNLKGTFLACRAMLPIMRENNWGRIVLVSSVVGQIGVPGTAAYAASKAGLFGLTRTLASENAGKNVTVNTLALGYFDRGMINVISAEGQKQICSTIPMKRLGDPRNIELAVRFLMDADYITGSVININGGLLS